MYVSTNGGDEWNKFRPEDPLNPLYPLCLDTAGTGRIFAVKNNQNGIYVLDSIYSNPSLVQENSLPQDFILYQNYPNPFNPTTKIGYQLPENTFVTLTIYDLLGRVVETLTNERMNAGVHNVNWNAATFPTGVYVVKLTAGNVVASKKLMLLK